MHVNRHLSHFLQYFILFFNYSILLRSSRGWKFMFNSFRLVKEVIIHIVKLSPLSLLILTIGWPISTCILLNKEFKCSMASYFSLRKLTKEYLEKSSTTTRTYLFPPLRSVCIGPFRSMWIRSYDLVILISLTFLCELLACFSFMHSP